MREQRFDDVCAELRREAFSSHVCGFVAARARGERSSLNQRHLRRFFQNHRVRRLRGRIVDVFDSSGDSARYEVRVGGRSAILETTDTMFQTTGGFSMWAQRDPEDEVVVFTSGRVRDVPLYLEWKLADDIMDLARERRADEFQPMARHLFDEIVMLWVSWQHEEAEAEPEPAAPSEGGAQVEATPERRRECRRHCRRYRECRQAGYPVWECRPEITSACRSCREEGAHR